MTVTDKYINPFTDFGFKKLFGTEPNKPEERLFEAAEIAKFTPEEKNQYEESLKSYRDLKNVIDTSYGDGKKEGIEEGKKEGKKEGIEEGKIEGKIEEKTAGIINALKQGKLTPDDIAEIFSTTLDFVLKIKEEYNL